MPTDRSVPDWSERPVGAVEQAIRDAIERGEFENLPGAGKPLPDADKPYDPDWWARRYVNQARTQDAADELRRTIRAELPRLRTMPDREAASSRIAQLNRMVVEINEAISPDQQIEPIA
jgi:hypothetical protein